jgi:hypothetical protein
MDINKEYFNDKSEAEKLRNVSSLVNDIVNTKPANSLQVTAVDPETEIQEEELPEVNPLVDLVGKAISKGKPKGFFMQGVQSDEHPKL